MTLDRTWETPLENQSLEAFFLPAFFRAFLTAAGAAAAPSSFAAETFSGTDAGAFLWVPP